MAVGRTWRGPNAAMSLKVLARLANDIHPKSTQLNGDNLGPITTQWLMLVVGESNESATEIGVHHTLVRHSAGCAAPEVEGRSCRLRQKYGPIVMDPCARQSEGVLPAPSDI